MTILSEKKADLCACVLIGGRSSRMGYPKHLIRGENKLTWLENTVSLLGLYVDEVVLSGRGNIPECLNGLTRIPDIDHLKGPLTGILAAMRSRPRACWLLIACDMPCIRKEAVDWLINCRRQNVYGVVPRLAEDGFVEPLLALYEPEARGCFEEMAGSGILKISRIVEYEKIDTPVVPEHLAPCWRNINTPEQLDTLDHEKKCYGKACW